MSKLNLANLAQNEVTQDEAQRAKGGLICTCYCVCDCPIEYRFEYRIQAKIEDRDYFTV